MNSRVMKWLVAVTCLAVFLSVGNVSYIAASNTILGTEKYLVQGSWVRSDAPYIVEINKEKGGELQATYFNRKPIHVEKTETAEKDGVFYIMILLQDVNYQGSFYLLSYDRVKDSLVGTYFHGGSRQRFDVDFIRKNKS